MRFYIYFLLFLSSVLNASILELSGTVVSENQKIITSRYMGFAKNVSVIEGERVKKGQLLYEIDSKEIDSAKSQVELMIEQAKLSLQMYQNKLIDVRLNLARHRRLYKKDVVSKYQFEQLQLAAKNLTDMVQIAKKQVLQAKAKLVEVKNQYKYLKIKAPNDGVIIQKSINDGEIAMPGIPAFILTDLSNLKIVAQVSEQNLKLFYIGKVVWIQIPSLGIEFKGKVFSIIPSSNPMTHTFKVKFSFPKKDNVYPGMYCKIIVK